MKLTRKQRRAAAKAPNWVRHIAASKAGRRKPLAEKDAAQRFLASKRRSAA